MSVHSARQVGRRQWKQASGYHKQGRAEVAFFRFKMMLGGRLRARDPEGQAVGVILACNVMKRRTELGQPASYALERQRGPRVGVILSRSGDAPTPDYEALAMAGEPGDGPS